MRLSIIVLLAIDLLMTSFARAAEPLRVMSFNIRYGTANDGENAWANRRELLFATVRKFDPHVLGLQEALVFQVGEITEAVPGYRVVGVGRDDGRKSGETSALLIKKDRCEVLDSGTFWLSDTPEVAGSNTWGNANVRICTWAKLQDESNQQILHAFNTHWDHVSQPARENSAKLIIDRIAARQPSETPVLLMGDFNAGEKNAAFRTLIESPLMLRDSFRVLYPREREVGTFNEFRGNRSGRKIDAILVSSQWTVLAAAIDRTSDSDCYPSDHFPVTAVITLEAAASR